MQAAPPAERDTEYKRIYKKVQNIDPCPFHMVGITDVESAWTSRPKISLLVLDRLLKQKSTERKG